MGIDIVENKNPGSITLRARHKVVGEGAERVVQGDISQSAAPNAKHDEIVSGIPVFLCQ